MTSTKLSIRLDVSRDGRISIMNLESEIFKKWEASLPNYTPKTDCIHFDYCTSCIPPKYFGLHCNRCSGFIERPHFSPTDKDRITVLIDTVLMILNHLKDPEYYQLSDAQSRRLRLCSPSPEEILSSRPSDSCQSEVKNESDPQGDEENQKDQG